MKIDDALTGLDRSEIEAVKLRMAFWVFMALLGSVNFQMLFPLAMSTVRRPPDNLVNNNNQLTLLIAGALCTGAGFFLGNKVEQREEVKPLRKDTLKGPDLTLEAAETNEDKPPHNES